MESVLSDSGFASSRAPHEVTHARPAMQARTIGVLTDSEPGAERLMKEFDVCWERRWLAVLAFPGNARMRETFQSAQIYMSRQNR